MSAEAIIWAWDQMTKDNQKLLLLLLAENASTEGIVAATRQVDLAKRLQVSDRTIRARLGKLQAEGLLSRLPTYTAGGKGRAADMILLHLPQFEVTLVALTEGIPEGSSKGIPEDFGESIPEDFSPSQNGSQSQSGSIPEDFDEKTASISSCSSPVIPSRTQNNAPSAVEASKVVADVPKVPKVRIDKLPLNFDEWRQALAIIRAFNEGAGTKFRLMGSRGDRPTEHLKRIVGRLRDNPEVTLDEHLAMIDRVCSNPWWKGTPTTVGVIYGPKVFARCLATDGRPTHGRTFANERRTSPEDAPW